MRRIGQDCITRRFKAIADKEAVPNDILTQIVRAASSDACRGIDLEDLVDDFVTFYIAGESTCVQHYYVWNFLKCTKVLVC